MSVIIRLQNLPWSANAADIRNYFSGLSIPEGGVHIIGGEQGDAFIAFSTDEDARQAMLKDAGKLKEVKIKLFLSSRTEMLRIIEQARQQAMKIQNLMHVPSVPPPVTVVASTKLLASPEVKKEYPTEDLTKKDDDNRRDKRDRSLSRDRSRGRGNDIDRSREKSRGRSYRDSDRGRRRRDRSRSRSRSRSRDRYRSRRSRSRDRKRNSRDKESKESNRGRNKDVLRNSDRQDNSESKGSSNSNSLPEWSQQQQHFQSKLPDPPAIPQKLLQMQMNGKDFDTPSHGNISFPEQDKRSFPFPNNMAPIVTPPFPPMPMRPRDTWPPMTMPPMIDPSQLAMQRAAAMMPNAEMTMPNYPSGFPMNQPMFPTQNITDPSYDALWRMSTIPPVDNTSAEPTSESSDLCIEIRGLPLNASYIDVKKLFDGLNIPSDGIKMINDTHGYRTGIGYVKFASSNHKKSALNQNGKKVRSNIVEVLHLRDSIYKSAVDNFKPDKDVILNSVDMDIDNSDITEEKWPNISQSKVLAHNDQDKVQITVPKMELQQRKIDYIRSNWVKIRGMPPNCGERDIFDLFSELGIAPIKIHFVHDNIGVKIGEAYCCFESNDDADKASTKHNTNMGRFVVSVIKVLRGEETERASNNPTMSAPLDPWHPGFRPPITMTGSLPFIPRMSTMSSDTSDNLKKQNNWQPPSVDERYNNKNTNDGYSNSIENTRFNKDPRAESQLYSTRGSNRGILRGGRTNTLMSGTGSLMNGSSINASLKSRFGPRIHPYKADPPYIDGDTLENFGRRGCVVSLENIHFKAEIDEIMDFFSGFNLEHEDVIRRFDDKGRPTGDARVALKNTVEALRAVKELNYRHLRGRSVKVYLLQ